MYIADLHIHSRYSRATSKDCTPEYLDLWARRKGIHIVGSGDFTHPAWRKELEEKLEIAANGLYTLKKEYRIGDDMAADTMQPYFVITGEISSIYKKNGRVRKVHSLIIPPHLEAAELISRKLEAIGNIHSDGRPILGLDCHDLLEIILESCPAAIYVPAHIWTPHFSLFGAFSGFDSVEECYGDLTPFIHAMETGLSSDPPMNWRVSALDNYQLISNSDAHSPAKLGREANLLDIDLSCQGYRGIWDAIQTGKGLAGTIEFFPEEGKYHLDGHRKCNLCLEPHETEKYGGICPVCGKKITIGVSHRIEQLADREEGYIRGNASAFESLMPLPEVISASIGRAPSSAGVQKEYRNMLQKLGAEFQILRELPLEEIRSVSGRMISEGIGRLRKGEVTRLPGFDGEYGIIRLFTPDEIMQTDGQMSFFSSIPGMGDEAAGDSPGKVTGRSASGGQTALEGQGVLKERTSSVEETLLEGQKLPERQVLAPNEKQQEATRAAEAVVAVTAGPGMGKTHTLVSHILYLMEERRVRPANITAVTFTNQAAKEMRERIQKRVGKGKSIRQMQIGTFHTLALNQLKEAGMEFTLAGEVEMQELADSVIKERGLNISVREFLLAVSRIKTTGYGTDEISERIRRDAGEEIREEIRKEIKEEIREEVREGIREEIQEAAADYQQYLADRKMLDFDDLLLEALRFAKEEEMGGCFTYLMVDEFQDISPLQYRLIKAWNQGGRQLYVIGDADQAIYGFRGADAACFKKLEGDFPDLHKIMLTQNYRSTPQILSLAEEVISKNPGGKRILCPNKPDGCAVRVVNAASEMAEAIFIAKEINRLAGGIGMLEAQEIFLKEEGRARAFDEIAVLYRTHRQADILETCLKKEGIPYVVAGRDDFLMDAKVRGTCAFFRSLIEAEGGNSGRSERSEGGEGRKSALKLLWGLEDDELSESIYKNMAEKYCPYLKKKRPEKILDEWIEDLGLEKNKAMQKLCRTAVFYSHMKEFLEALTLGTEGDLRRSGGRKCPKGAVNLMTLHGAKGLEFPVTIIFGANQGMIPFESERHTADIEEERRLFYVGITRGKEELILTTSGEESEFLKDISKEKICWEKADKRRGADGGKQMSLFDLVPTIISSKQ